MTATWFEFEPILLELSKLDTQLRVDLFGGRTFYEFKRLGVVTVSSGIGLVNAAITTQALLDHYGSSKIDFILFAGIAGSLNVSYREGDVVVPRQWMTITHQRLLRKKLMNPRDNSTSSSSCYIVGPVLPIDQPNHWYRRSQENYTNHSVVAYGPPQHGYDNDDVDDVAAPKCPKKAHAGNLITYFIYQHRS
jgi:hypothetical protein